MNFTKRCLICDKPRRGEWRSDIWIVVGKGLSDKHKVTICPKCRRKPIDMIYSMITYKMLKKSLGLIEKNRKLKENIHGGN